MVTSRRQATFVTVNGKVISMAKTTRSQAVCLHRLSRSHWRPWRRTQATLHQKLTFPSPQQWTSRPTQAIRSNKRSSLMALSRWMSRPLHPHLLTMWQSRYRRLLSQPRPSSGVLAWWKEDRFPFQEPHWSGVRFPKNLDIFPQFSLLFFSSFLLFLLKVMVLIFPFRLQDEADAWRKFFFVICIFPYSIRIICFLFQNILHDFWTGRKEGVVVQKNKNFLLSHFFFNSYCSLS